MSSTDFNLYSPTAAVPHSQRSEHPYSRHVRAHHLAAAGGEAQAVAAAAQLPHQAGLVAAPVLAALVEAQPALREASRVVAVHIEI
jgi:hypothetical protein